MKRVRQLLNVDQLHRQGFTGRGIHAAILDTGAGPHPDYEKRLVLFRDFLNHQRENYDDASHGSHVTGILGGDGTLSGGEFRGIAPECGLIHLKVLDHQGNGKMGDVIRALEWILDNYEHYHIRVLNISVGTPKDDQDDGARQLLELVERVWDAGVVVVVAAGNMGPGRSTITVPGSSRKVITVGSSDDFVSGRGRARLNYSGRGPTAECICKPDLVAPGSNICSCRSIKGRPPGYCYKSGTSMATPVISGIIALLLQKRPYLSNVEVKMLLKQSCRDLGFPREFQGWGMPDGAKLLEAEL